MKAAELLRGSLYLLLASIISRGSSLVFRYLAATNLSTDDYGILSLYVSLFLSMSAIASFGVGPAMAKLAACTSNSKADIDAFYNNSILLTFATSLVAGCVYVLLMDRESVLLSIPMVLVTIGGLIFWSYYQLSIGFSFSGMKFGLASIYEASDGLVKLLLLLIAYVAAIISNLFLYVVVFSMSYAVLAAIAFLINNSVLGIDTHRNPFSNFNGGSIRKIFDQSFALMTITFTNLFFGFVLRWFLSKESNYNVAVFDMAFTLYSVPRMMFASLVRPVVPYASKADDLKIKVPPLRPFILTYLLALTAAIAIQRSGYAEVIFRGIKLKDYIMSFSVFIVMLSGSIFDLGFGYLSSYFQGIGKVKVISVISIGVFFVLVPFSYLLVKQYALYGAAAAFCSFTMLTTAITVIYGIKIIGFKN